MGLDETLEAKLLDFYFNKRDYNQDEFVSRAEFYNAATSHDELWAAVEWRIIAGHSASSRHRDSTIESLDGLVKHWSSHLSHCRCAVILNVTCTSRLYGFCISVVVSFVCLSCGQWKSADIIIGIILIDSQSFSCLLCCHLYHRFVIMYRKWPGFLYIWEWTVTHFNQ